MLLKGKPVADKIKDEILKEVEFCKENGKNLPRLAILRVGERPDDIAYEARILKNCKELGMIAEVVQVDNNIDMENFLGVLQNLNENPEIHGILIFRPLPKQLDMEIIAKTIKPEKDIDCMSPVNTEKVFNGDNSGIAPCTPEAVIEILKYYQYDLRGKNVAVINRSMVLGRPLAMLFLGENATVTICHSKTENLSQITSNADIVVTGAGKGKYFGADYFSEKSVVVDVGINFVDNVMCGDIDFEPVAEKAAAVTPVPGGVGTVTSMILLYHVIKAMKLQEQ
ncbi:bifunctional 5,10-methylenetetrahydrofolate dehydrogenase/5,10-methenyltetrahydrofolate cyclohydrolase [Sinanaerobacter chloroacetimidivorans]|jgi:methylenetetrahydrofolate dehydrogenase (NADP+)/methenyltetrahydrofolate cyclohydrolase|uniref:Bifunctional protein FolD n=1 Tax=Sinanaerobacter chloroacetimidivorans TaxID=2818044 RepID=A0A8J7VXW7_9FIRM|nr:bifunctional 5,10-methylenetetrahydrofolate dehydrogenase/5,10-methenyltetrahydrofolate cyclohydrolase [Sinanaerobacter chloroacetimidivorans]MBR0596721.1 bifunctional 5,10-methylenetetrahydrofolate dehydrogenase/5,10-methenyltetrahydrofolate cyclohydrolase [Sinanaerobacter chloroacetimidivorans]